MNEFYNKINPDNKLVTYELIDNLEGFGINKIFINKFLNGLWKKPEVMFKILNHSEPREIKTNLGPLVIDNFYTNYLSGNYIENNLLYIITLMIDDEIKKLTDIEQVETFLDNTRCGYILEELQKKADIQLFFKNVIIKTIENIEKLHSFKAIKFNTSKIDELINKLKESHNKNDNKLTYENLNDINNSYCRDDASFKGKNKDEQENFVKNYIPSINIEELEKRSEKALNEKNKDLSEYFQKIIKDIKDSNDYHLYSNDPLMKNLLNTQNSPLTLNFYKSYFLCVINFIDQIINDLLENILLLPYSVKCICKIISVLIKNKFKNISKTEENGFISKFILGRLLIPIISSPSFNALISEFVISDNTINNIKEVNIILKKFFSGNLFKSKGKDVDYTLFNSFFLNRMEKILVFFENATNVNLPLFIEDFINNKLPKDYQYDYFVENKEEIYTNISICFNIHTLNLLLKGYEKCQNTFNKNDEKVSNLQKAYDKIIDAIKNKSLLEIEKLKINYLKEKLEEKKKEKNKEKHNEENIEFFFLNIDKIIEKKYEKLFKIDNKIANFFIDIKELEKQNQSIDEEKMNIINVKNYLCNSIGNYRLLNICDFHKEATTDTIKMLTEIKAYMVLPNFIINNNTIPSNWYIISLLNSLNNLPKEYKENDFEQLFLELKDDINKDINNLDFQRLIIFRNKLKFIDKMNNYYDQVQHLIQNISINETIKRLVEKAHIPVEIEFNYTDEENSKNNKFNIKYSNKSEKFFEDGIKYEDPKKNIYILKTIEAFTIYFPNLAKYQLLQDKNPINILRDLSIPDKIDQYFGIIKERLIKEKILKRENISEVEYVNSYQEKIKDYVMNKIYEKIYPPEPDEKDSKIFRLATIHSWIEPKMLLDNNYIYDNILPDILNQFKLIHQVKTPFKMVKCIDKIFELIYCLVKFNEGNNNKLVGSDDITPILLYIFIKANPFRIYTDLEFVKAFFKDENIIQQLEAAYLFLFNISNDKLKLTLEDYNQRCEAAQKNIDFNV